MEIVFYTIECPACKVLEQKLIRKNIPFTKVDDIAALREMGLEQFPVLGVNGELLSYSKAVKWVNEYES